MTALVGVFTFSGLSTLPIVSGKDHREDSVQAHKYPMLGRDMLSCDTTTADSSEASAAPALTGVAWLQVQNGKRVYLELAHEGATLTTATSLSPIIEGNHSIPFGPGWRISVLEVA